MLSSYESRLPGLKKLPRVNVLDEWPGPQGKGSAFPVHLAREAAKKLWESVPLERPFLILSIRAAGAFGIRRSQMVPLAEWFEFKGRQVAVIPHPSGIVTWWNDLENRAKARRFMEDLTGVVA